MQDRPPGLPLPGRCGLQWLLVPGALAAVQHVAATGGGWARSADVSNTKLVTGRSGGAWWPGVADQTGVVTTVACLFITVQRVA